MHIYTNFKHIGMCICYTFYKYYLIKILNRNSPFHEHWTTANSISS